MMHTVLWNGFTQRLEVFRGSEESLRERAKYYLDEGADVIYFYATIEKIVLKEE